ncbi:oxidoreductase [Ignicoccus islandicus DSM 13165]|uniref:Oxidoreductase n=1 Tax=Ignicoccus islandicus DSM 13165 TaxID=940295 RepID=A0A0U2VBG7_9CREN|nr:aldo/keto reductase [Ignicoccus islandicus]ALU11426.1 oxidoreductase [Ignicoccus islandicus DSM 13165]
MKRWILKWREIGGEKVSAIGLGSWDVRNPKAFLEVLLEAFSRGVNLVDTAEMYKTEPIIGEALAAYGDKDSIFVTTKLYPWHLKDEEECFKALERQRERLGKVPDLTLVHWPEDIATEVRVLEKAAEKGLTRMIGVSNVNKEQLEVALSSTKKHPIVAVQNKYSYTFRRTEELIPILEERNIALQAHTPLDKGKFPRNLLEVASEVQLPPATVALLFLLSRSKVVIPIPKTENKKHLEEILLALETELPEEALRKLE